MPVLTPNQIVSLNELGSGVTIYQFSTNDYSQLNWTRAQNNPSTCDLVVPPAQAPARLDEIAPWLHWVTVWDGDDSSVLWTGPVQKATSAKKAGLTLNCKDPAAYLARTRMPMSKRYDNTDPAVIAGEQWQRMIELQGLRAKPVVRPDPDGNRYSFQTTENEKLLDAAQQDLVELGLVWTVVSGVPILGPLTKDPLTTLSDADFVGDDDIQLVRDGTATYNDVLAKAEGSNVNIAVPYYGQSLQTIKNLDHLSDVSNITKAARAYAALVAQVRTRLVMPGGAILHPNANVSIDQLMPSARFIIETQGIRDNVLLTQIECARSAGQSTVKVTMDTALTVGEVVDLELDTATKGKPTTSLTSAGSTR